MQGGLRLVADLSPCAFCLVRTTARVGFASRVLRGTQTRAANTSAVEKVQAQDESEYLREVQLRFGAHPPGPRPRKRASKYETVLVDERFLDAKLEYVAKATQQDPVVSNIDNFKERFRTSITDYRSHLRSIVRHHCMPKDLPSWLERTADLLLRQGAQRIKSKALQDGFVEHLVMSGFSEEDIQLQKSVANLAYPSEWFPATRSVPRKFHVHIGPTNSGKTYQALKRLREASSGFYGGPLRLLAQEVYMRLNADGLRCNLVTGDDRRAGDENNPEANHISCTVEMLPLNHLVDVAVIDEIQMLGHSERGAAWTQALLGVQAREIHLCGEERALPIVQQLVALCGDTLEVHRYERLSPLELMPQSLHSNLENLRKGDCVVCFQIKTIHAVRQQIEKSHGVKCAMIYGSLPPETRAQQAALFNDPDNDYDILVASDAVGMGLNLNIQRMIFQASSKYSSQTKRDTNLEVHEIKQIGGRAGRFSTAENDISKSLVTTAHSNHDGVASTLLKTQDLQAAPITSAMPPPRQAGLVGCLDASDYEVVRRGFEGEAAPITAAGLWPPSYVLDRFSKLFPLGTPFSFMLKRLSEFCQMNPRFFICNKRAGIALSDAIESVRGLSIHEKSIFNTSPASMKSAQDVLLIREYAELVASGKTASIVDIENLNLELMDSNHVPSHRYLSQIEELHKGIVLYLWLSYRFPAVFLEPTVAVQIRSLCERRIARTLAALSFDINKTKRHRRNVRANLRNIRRRGQENTNKVQEPDELDDDQPLIHKYWYGSEVENESESENYSKPRLETLLKRLANEGSRPNRRFQEIPADKGEKFRLIFQLSDAKGDGKSAQ